MLIIFDEKYATTHYWLLFDYEILLGFASKHTFSALISKKSVLFLLRKISTVN